VLSRRRLTILVAAAMMMVAMLAAATPAFATHCVNVHKPQGAGTQAFEHNGGRAGYFYIGIFPGAPQVDVFVHPQRGSLPEGAHDSEGWTEL
jgi:hypothetical protein